MCFKSIVIVFYILLFRVHIIISQEVKVQRSTEKVKLQGKEYYIHIIKKGETLYSISKAYNVSQKEIALENPKIFEGLQEGETLKIPVKIPVSAKTISEEKIDKSGKYIMHLVQKGETLYSLSKEYNVNIQEILTSNPELKQGLKAGQTIKIPRKIEISKTPQAIELGDRSKKKEFIFYTVKKKETLYSIARRYNVSIDTLYIFNPKIKSHGLKAGQTIKIPARIKKTKRKELVTKQAIEQKKQDTTIQEIKRIEPEKTLTIQTIDTSLLYKPKIRDTQLINKTADTILPHTLTLPCDSINEKLIGNKFNIAIFLPLFLDVNDTIQAEKVIADREQFFPNTNFIEFYEGCLLGLKKFKEMNKNFEINIYVFDTERDTTKMSQILKKPEIKNLDLIIGPVYLSQIKMVADYVLKNHIYLASPFITDDSIIVSNPFFIQINPSFEVQIKNISRIISYYINNNIVIIHNETEEESRSLRFIESYIAEVVRDTVNIPLKIVSFKEGMKKIIEQLDKEKENIIVIPSNNEPFVTDIITRLYALLKNYNISVIAFPGCHKFENLELRYFYELQLKSFSSNYIDYQNPYVKDFIKEYREIYRTEPSKYSFAGYDIMFYFINILKRFGRYFRNCLTQVRINTLQYDFNFSIKNNSGGLENTTIFVIQYDKEYNIRAYKCIDFH